MRKKARTPATLRGTTLVSARQDNDFTLRYRKSNALVLAVAFGESDRRGDVIKIT
jgi:hypothetical protein